MKERRPPRPSTAQLSATANHDEQHTRGGKGRGTEAARGRVLAG